jgi:hypothetical protein
MGVRFLFIICNISVLRQKWNRKGGKSPEIALPMAAT